MKVEYNDKILDAMYFALHSRLLCLEGAARSGKTMVFSDVLYYAVISSKEKYHVIAARDLDAINNNILNAEVVGLLTLHPDCKIKKDRVGGNYVSVIGIDGKEKHINLVNYSNESSWKKILGGTKGIIYVDEVNIANESFIDECFARQLSADEPRTFWTLNGDDPNHPIYTKYINYCKMYGKIPAPIIKDMKEFQSKNGIKQGWKYMHFTMWDNPAMLTDVEEDGTYTKIKNAYSIFKEGSFYFNTKILGIRGTANQLLFNELMSDDLIVDWTKYRLTNFTYGLDVGGGRAFNSIHLIGYEANFRRAIVLAEKVFDVKGYDKKKPIIYQFISDTMKAFNINYSQVDGCMIDCAEQNFIADIKPELLQLFRINAVGSYKATIKDRIDMMAIGFSTKRILFNTLCRDTYQAYLHAQRGDKAFERLDTNETNAKGDNDRMDSCEYSLTRHMKSLMSMGGNY